MTQAWRYGILAAALLLTASAASGQQHALDRGSLQVAGSASLTSTGSDDDDTDDRVTTAALNPRLLYFFMERLAIGGDLVLGYTKFSDDLSSWTVGIGPSITYYFGAPAATVHPYLAARAALATVSFETPVSDNDGNRRSATAAAGILAMLSRSVGVTSELFYQVERQELGTFENHINTFGLAVGIAAFVF